MCVQRKICQLSWLQRMNKSRIGTKHSKHWSHVCAQSIHKLSTLLGEQLCVIDVLSVSQRCCAALSARKAVIHFQVQAAAVQSHFNTNCLLPDKGACALPLTPLCFLRACATLVAVDTKYQLLSQTFTKGVKKTQKKLSLSLRLSHCLHFPQLWWSSCSSVRWLWPAGLKSPKKMTFWCWRKVTSTRLSKLILTFWLNSVSKTLSYSSG